MQNEIAYTMISLKPSMVVYMHINKIHHSNSAFISINKILQIISIRIPLLNTDADYL